MIAASANAIDIASEIESKARVPSVKREPETCQAPSVQNGNLLLLPALPRALCEGAIVAS